MDNHFIEESRTSDSRYQALLSGENYSLAEHDQTLMELHDCVVTPTLGSIVPNWLLIIPREHKVNFTHWRKHSSFEPVDIIGELTSRIGISAQRAIWFEHGPDHAGSVMGCGVDHAHLHVLVDPPFTFQDLSDAAQKASNLNWSTYSSTEVYSSIPVDSAYLVASGGDEAISAINTHSVGSQFFRRVIADLIGQSDAWNYRTHPHIENVRKTLQTFENLSI